MDFKETFKIHLYFTSDDSANKDKYFEKGLYAYLRSEMYIIGYQDNDSDEVREIHVNKDNVKYIEIFDPELNDKNVFAVKNNYKHNKIMTDYEFLTEYRAKFISIFVNLYKDNHDIDKRQFSGYTYPAVLDDLKTAFNTFK